MSCYIGIDIGAVSCPAAVLADGPQAQALGALAAQRFACRLPAAAGQTIFLLPYRRTRGRGLEAAMAVLGEILGAIGAEEVGGLALTGSGAERVARRLGTGTVNEFRAIADGLSALGVEARTVFEMGGESSKYLRLASDDEGVYTIADYSTNGDCAAGTGSFIDQQANRLKYRVEEIGRICNEAERSAQIAGRCSVFAKSDMIHAQQKGYDPAEVLRGLCDAVARNFRTAVVRSHEVEPPVVFIGGMTANEAVVRAMRESFDLDESQMTVPPGRAHVAAVGAAAAAQRRKMTCDLNSLRELLAEDAGREENLPTQQPLELDNVVLLRDRAQPAPRPQEVREVIDGYLGIDIGSVSTNLVVIDRSGRMICEIYTRTQGRPIEVVSEALRQIHAEWGPRLRILGVGTTGSGRELIGQLVGADTVNDEITAHKTGATFVGRTMLGGRVPDTIFEIGGQDSKYISLQDGVVVDFTMNEACAAGTGSFLEERAEELEIAIKGEFAQLALSSRSPIRLGERCTVFMERDVNACLNRGARKDDIVAGLAYSVVYNYINRVVRGRPVGECIFFQGGTAYNDAVAAAFAAVCGKEIIVPPHNGVIGAIGAALLASERMQAAGSGALGPDAAEDDGRYVSELAGEFDAAEPSQSRFRGYDLSQVDYTLREFTCRSCSNACQIQEFTVEGEKTYWGDKCSDRFRKASHTRQKPVIEDLFSLRQQWLLDEEHLPAVADDAPAVGIPMTMFAWEQLPFWRTLLHGCGLRTVLSEQTNKQIIRAGLASAVAEPCFPIIVAHGHVAKLLEQDLSYLLLPNIISQETRWPEVESHLCPWHQTLPFVVRQAPGLREHAERFLTPTVRFADGRKAVQKTLERFFVGRGIDRPRIRKAVQAAYEAQDRFRDRLRQAGVEALETLQRSGETGIVLVGRPYNVHDAGVNLSVARKLREQYGVNCLPLDMLPTDEVDISDVNSQMYWALGRGILAAAKIVGERENLHIIYITNFKCGPDSFIKHFVRRAAGKPFLSLQFDGHSNDAGMMTRCEAYLDSKKVLRPWRTDLATEDELQPAK